MFAGVRISLIIRQFLDAAPILDSGIQRKVTEDKKESLYVNYEVTETRNELMTQVSFRKEIHSTKTD